MVKKVDRKKLGKSVISDENSLGYRYSGKNTLIEDSE